ncbi:MAG: iron-sulfur cluster repair di-iron protein [Firmicutes bacterium]|nr:iron-sulfur cluster repair di-iron protein [Bacillota bacterium]
MTQFSGTEKIGDVVAHFPGATEVFRKYKIDFCCGGDRPLHQALREQGLNEQEVLSDLESAWERAAQYRSGQIDWREAPMSELIDHIVSTHHGYLRNELPALSELTMMILRAHGAQHGDTLRQVHKLFHNLKTELEQHLIKEEEMLFPLIKDYETTNDKAKLDQALKILDELEAEHEGAGDVLKELRQITGEYAVPADGCPTYDDTYRRLVRLEEDMFQHIHLENNILHPRLRAEKNN